MKHLPLILIGFLAIGSGPGLAATFTVDTSQGDGELDVQDDATVEEGFNPTISCSIDDDGTIYDLLYCLLDEIITIPGIPCFDLIIESEVQDTIGQGHDHPDEVLELQQDNLHSDCPVSPEDREDFIVRLLPKMPPYGLEILTLDLEEIEKITLRENDPSIQWTTLTLDKSHRRLRIGDIVEKPSGRGAIYLTLNDRELKIPTRQHRTPVELTAAIVRALRLNGFAVEYEAPYTWVTFDARTRRHITKVGFRSTDPAILTSDLGLLPPDPSNTEPRPEIQPVEILGEQGRPLGIGH